MKILSIFLLLASFSALASEQKVVCTLDENGPQTSSEGKVGILGASGGGHSKDYAVTYSFAQRPYDDALEVSMNANGVTFTASGTQRFVSASMIRSGLTYFVNCELVSAE